MRNIKRFAQDAEMRFASAAGANKPTDDARVMRADAQARRQPPQRRRAAREDTVFCAPMGEN